MSTPCRAPLTNRMQTQIDQWHADGDSRAIFLDCYRLMTANMLIALEQDEFTDPVWVHSLLHRFADYYFDALDAYERDDPAMPQVWRMTHQIARSNGALVLQHLMLGVNAHINYDLVLTLADLLEPEWATLDGEKRRQRYADHSHVNLVIARTIDTVQDQVITRLTPAFFVVDRLLGRVDEWATARLISVWRDTVWHRAVEVLDAPGVSARAAVRHHVEEVTLRRAHTILQPVNLPALRTLFGPR
jgi:hypothetical protein